MDIRLINLFKSYKTSEDRYIDSINGINVDINYQNYVSFVGPSGCGKSTLLNMITGILKPTKGEVYWGKYPITKTSDKIICEIRRKKFGIIFQETKFVNELNVEDNILLPLVISSIPVEQKIKYCNILMEKLKIYNIRKRYPDQISGGEKKKVAIARALINNPEIIVADEPTANLDNNSAIEVFNIFTNLNKMGLTVIIATHDERFGNYCKEVYFMENGQIKKFLSKESKQ